MTDADQRPVALSDRLSDDVQAALWLMTAGGGPPATETLMRSEDGGAFWDLYLGSDDCETCGPSMDELSIGVEDGRYSWHLHVGCYTTVEFDTRDQDEFVEYLRTEIPYFQRAFPAYLAEFRQIIAEVGAL